jgi:hypothetical protein
MIENRQNTTQKWISLIGLIIAMLMPFFQSCSTIRLTDRMGKDYNLQESEYMKLRGIFVDSAIIDYPKKSNNLSGYIYAPCTVKIVPLKPNRLEYSYFINDSLVTSKILRGKIKDGYFMQRTKFGIEFTFGPLLWGPGTQKFAYGITNENNLIYWESHGGIAVFIVLPFFAGGGDSKHEYKRIE